MVDHFVDDGVVDVTVIGAGVVGCAIARHLARYEISVKVVERSNDVGNGTSKANTAILHTGFDCVPGTLESSLVRRGYDLLGSYAALAGIAVECTGGLLVAWDDEQFDALPALQEKAVLNGYAETRLLSAQEVREREPNLGEGVRGGLDVPGESIICPWSTTLAFAKEAASAEVTFLFNTTVTGVAFGDDESVVTTTSGDVRTRWVINAAGLSSSEVDGLCDHHDFTVTPRRGELIVFDKLARDLIRSIILPVPTSRTKGVLVAPTVYGNLLLGPTAEDVDDPFDTATTQNGLAGLLDAGRRILPSLLNEEVTATYAGLRAATEHQDYQIRSHPDERYVCVGGIRSTGLTSSMAIAEHVVQLMVDAGMALTERADATVVPLMPPLGESQRRRYDDVEAIARRGEYGEIVCHCERVSRGEILDACVGEFAALDVGGLRRRTRAMNGRCQGFYCAAEVVALLNELTTPPPSSSNATTS
ncbi:MAG TPA: NAD(P)/FAD-dependent oxidoreductase [Acidimicrobiales bacterium]|nr:NAD(P)/FAD-dependent oxidoreductase [Acidimicrobiales bacterium]